MAKVDCNIISLNVRGITDRLKRMTIFRYLQRHKCDIAFLQETYSCDKEEVKWLNDWNGEGVYVHGTKHSRGVLTLFRRGLDYKILTIRKDIGGRFLILKVSLQDRILYLINVYAPNNENEQLHFFRDLKLVMEHEGISDNDNIILGGDLNIVMDGGIDKCGGNVATKQKSRAQLSTLIDNFELLDIWRIRNPDVKRFTWRQKTPRIQCRLDYYLVSNNIAENVVKVDIKPSLRSDHSAINLELKFLPDTPRGPGHWKFNTSLLEDPIYCNSLEQNALQWMNNYMDIEDKNIKWELLKYEVRKFSMQYSKEKKQNSRNREAEIEAQLKILEEDIDKSPNPVLERELVDLKVELEQIDNHKAQAMIIQSRAQWHEKGEKSTAYFFGLQKRNYIKKNASKLLTPQGTEVTNPKKILEMQREFYKNLYSTYPVDLEELALFSMDNIPKLSVNEQMQCEGEITEAEAKKTLDTFESNKSPGNDGIPSEFYEKFWPTFGRAMIESFNYSYKNGLLTTSQRQAIITLLEKEGKDRLYVQNWRPISLLNVDYKILSKCLAERIKPLLPKLIHYNQTGFVKDRNITDNLRTILDILEDTKNKNMHGLLMTIDFEKAFDSISWKYLYRSLEAYNFSKPFIAWIKLLYQNIFSCVINHNTSSTYFEILRGVRQGDPLSPYLFILAIELLSIYIRNDENIHGLNFKGEDIKILTYADDSTAFLRDIGDAKRLLSVLDKFQRVSGLKINKSKSEGLWLGIDRNSNRKPLGIAWPEHIKLLGVSICYNEQNMANLNFNNKLRKMKQKINLWKRRNLSIMGKILILKTYGISQLLYISSIINVPDWVVIEAENIMYSFLWNGKQHKVKKKVVIQNIVNGGCNMCDLPSMIKVQKLKWIKKYFDKSFFPWKNTMQSICNIERLDIFLNSNFDPDSIHSNFYSEVLKAWKEVKYNKTQSATDILNQIIWYNSSLKFGKSKIVFEEMVNKGIIKLHQLCKENGSLRTYQELCNEYELNRNLYLQYMGLCHAIPAVWKHKIRANQILKNFPDCPILHQGEIKSLLDIDNKSLYALSIEKKIDVSKACKTFSEKYDVSKEEWKLIYANPHKLGITNKIKETQYKIVHNYLATNSKLCKMGKIDSERCNFCFMYQQDLEHLIISCNIIKNFWLNLTAWLNTHIEENVILSERDIFFGYRLDGNYSIVNKVILYGKQYICECKYNDREPQYLLFMDLLETKYNVLDK